MKSDYTMPFQTCTDIDPDGQRVIEFSCCFDNGQVERITTKPGEETWEAVQRVFGQRLGLPVRLLSTKHESNCVVYQLQQIDGSTVAAKLIP